jgi:hypothetical protein
MIKKVQADTEETAADMTDRIKAHAAGNAAAIQVGRGLASLTCRLLPRPPGPAGARYAACMHAAFYLRRSFPVPPSPCSAGTADAARRRWHHPSDSLPMLCSCCTPCPS